MYVCAAVLALYYGLLAIIEYTLSYGYNESSVLWPFALKSTAQKYCPFGLKSAAQKNCTIESSLLWPLNN
jgi:hypothetical protein